MNYLIDTHIFLWIIKGENRFSKKQLEIFENANGNIYISNISFLEIALKFQKGKLNLSGFTPDQLPKIAKELGLKIVNFNAEVMATLYQLPQIKNHKDPFDRLLIWFCIQNNDTFISNDSKLHPYEEQGLKWI